MDRLETLAKGRGLEVFARINFAKDAAAAGLALQPTHNRCWVSFNTPDYLQQRHGFPAELVTNIAELGKARAGCYCIRSRVGKCRRA
jgi:hypothetical protein